MPSRSPSNALSRFGTVYTDPRQLNRAFRQDESVAAILNHLQHSSDKSFVLLGPSGAGKTAILHEVFRRLVKSDKRWTVVQTSSAELMSGTKYIGEWQTRVTEFISIAKARDNILIYISDLHNLTGAGRSENDESNMAEVFGPAMERRKIIVAGESTPASYRTGIEQVPGLQRNLTTFKVSESTPEETAEIIKSCFKSLRGKYKRTTGHGVVLSEPALNGIVSYGDIYFPNDTLPGGAVRLLERVVAQAIEWAEASPSKDDPVKLGQTDVVKALEHISGVPARLLDDAISLSPVEVRKFFDTRVVGQGDAVSAVCDLITMVKAGLTDPGKPLGVMLFVGPTGVGKTELAKALAEFLFGSQDRLIRCDMSEFKDAYAFEKLIGVPFGGGTSAKSNSLISRVRQQPFSVVLLDEIEKAHPNVYDVLLQAFDDGRLTDPAGNTTNLTQTIMIMTSNLGGDLAASPPMGFGSEGIDLTEETDKALRGFFRPEFLNRIDHILRFWPLGREETRTLARRELGRAVLRSGITRRELRVDIDPAVIDVLVSHGFSKLYGARPLRRAVEQHALLPIAKQIVELGEGGRGVLLRLSARGENVVAEVVRDRQTKTARRITRGIRVEDAVGAGIEKIRPKQIEQELALLNQTIADLEAEARRDNLEERKSGLVERSSEADFWDVPEDARWTLSEIYRIERLLDAIARISSKHLGISAALETAARGDDSSGVAEGVKQLRATQRHAELVLFGIKCHAPEDRRDAFVYLELVGEEAPDQNLVADMAHAYLKWGRRKSYDTLLVHEENCADNPGLTKAVVLEIAGPAAYGILRSERGLHEFAFGKTADRVRMVHHVSVRVLPVPGEKEMEDAPRVNVRTRSTKKVKSLFGDDIRTRMVASLDDGSRSINLLSPLSGDEASEVGLRLLLAEKHLAEEGKTEVVRKYTISPRPAVRDPNVTGTKIKLHDFWEGDIDVLLHAGIRARREQE